MLFSIAAFVLVDGYILIVGIRNEKRKAARKMVSKEES